MRDSGEAPELVAICGTPSPLTQWAVNLVHRLATQAWGPHVFVGANSEGEFLDALDRSKDRPVILFAHVPSRALMDRIVQTFDRVLLVQDDPVDVVGYLRDERKLLLWNAASLASQSITALAYLRCNARTAEVRSDVYALPLDAARARLMAAVGIAPPTTGAAAGAASELRVADRVASRVLAEVARARAPGTYFDGAAEIDRSFLAALAPHFESAVAGAGATRFVWPSPLFMGADKKGQAIWAPLVDDVDLTGPARAVVHGPYLNLPIGDWTLKATLAVEGNASGNALLADILASGAQLARIRAPLPHDGEFAFEVDFHNANPLDPVLLRLEIGEGAIEGSLRLVSVKVLRRAGPG